MLTVDYDRLGLRAGERLLDIGCGFGRHTYEALRRGASVVSCDLGRPELVEIASMVAAMYNAGEAPAGVSALALQGDSTRLPFNEDSFERVVASEVLEHIADDGHALRELCRVLKPGGTIAVTVPAWLAEKVCWALSPDYPAPASPGGHVRIYTEAMLRSQLRDAGLEPGAAHLAHALHTPYWWLRCAVGLRHPIEHNRAVAGYHRLLCRQITQASPVLNTIERALNPLLGKSLVIYARKPGNLNRDRVSVRTDRSTLHVAA